MNISLSPEILFHIGAFPVTNSMLMSWIVSIGLILAFVVAARRWKEIPGKLQLFMEVFLVGSHDFVEGTSNGNQTVTRRMFPFFTTMAVFFLVSNLMTLLPLAWISVNDTPLFRTPTSDYATIFVITMFSFILFQVVAVVTGGAFGYIKKFFNFSSPIQFVLGLLDIIGELAKIVSLSFRLFGNIFAGEVLATIMLSLVPFIAPLPFAFLGILSGVIQAFVFPILVLIFVNMAIATRAEAEKAKAPETAAASTT